MMYRIYSAMRRTAVIDAVKFELVNRVNRRVANDEMLPGDKPRPPLNYLANSMAHAREFESKANLAKL